MALEMDKVMPFAMQKHGPACSPKRHKPVSFQDTHRSDILRPHNRLDSRQIYLSFGNIHRKPNGLRRVATPGKVLCYAISERCLVEIWASNADKIDSTDDRIVKPNEVLIGSISFSVARCYFYRVANGGSTIVVVSASVNPLLEVGAVFDLECQ